jgi:putative transposase
MGAWIYTVFMEIYHALNRGVDGRDIFKDDRDRIRFVHDLFEFNDQKLAPHTRSLESIGGFVNPQIRKRLVTIHGWCLMRNHYHLILSERVDGGISLFLRKLNVGYANYFNERYGRKGTLFQGRTKKILIEHQAHFLYILHYVHLNPLDYLKGAEKWRERDKSNIKNAREALQYLNTYRWSSYLDYMSQSNFPSIISTSLFSNSPKNYAREIQEYLKDTESIDLNDVSSGIRFE